PPRRRAVGRRRRPRSSRSDSACSVPSLHEPGNGKPSRSRQEPVPTLEVEREFRETGEGALSSPARAVWIVPVEPGQPGGNPADALGFPATRGVHTVVLTRGSRNDDVGSSDKT